MLTLSNVVGPPSRSWTLGLLRGCSYATEATFETRPFKLHKLENGPSTSVKITKEEALQYYRDMLVIQQMETKAHEMCMERVIRGFCHLYFRQEAVAVGVEHAITKEDAVITSHRAHGWTYMRGVSVLGIMAELAGRASGCAKGKGGSMHMYCTNFYGGNGIVGAQVPLGAGIAFAMKYSKKSNVCVTVYGDGAANQGQIFEAFNMAKLLDLPCIFVCENNLYGMGTLAERASANTDFYKRGDYIPGIWVDGVDVLAVKSATEFAKAFVLKNGPILLEASTYPRYQIYLRGDIFRSREEVLKLDEIAYEWTREPIRDMKKRILSAELATVDDLQNIDNEIRQEVKVAAERSKIDPELPVEEVYTNIYHQPPPDFRVRGCDPTIKAATR
ncbi:pyruvate dehydrogenase E1 component subunit alpha, mitochondrial-like isoform X1 [Pomacea canaliculata]|uniref:pyruvate dehydrogenase E1 component subunit alpha, mitochondrial-like isoform X1 n=2 Tax=Pomacea canaliculata TaxID=400727 RepID=UPI000D736D24|nr:pyruvate dehydrogenase E1 component subunit alpha, mitochondrial-like isoform X1 [Pomacea canaliculata]